MDIGLTIVGTLFVGGALFYTAKTFRNTKKIDQLKQAQDILDKLDNLDKELPDIDTETDIGKEKLRLWEQRLFNTLEWLGYLLNNKLIKDEKIKDYFKNDVINWFEGAFATSENKDAKNPEYYKEFRKMYDNFKNQ